jgi:diguanylate cyclase (GGDEF)-like protein
MDSSVGLAIQCAGIFLVTLLSFFMMRWFQSVSTKYWTIAWTCLSVSLISLFAGFHLHGEFQRICYSVYFLGEYCFGLMFVAGCRHHATGRTLSGKNVLVFAPFALVAGILPHLSGDFNNLFIVQAFLMAGLFGTALSVLRPARRRGNVSPGVRVMSAALLLLALDFLHYVPVFGSHQGAWGLQVPDAYFKYTSIFDLILEILLGFGTMMVLMEGVRREVEAMNRELTAARDRLEQIARIDPLTGALTRHAFDTVLSSQEKGHGCVAIIDLDNLKPVNDRYGHTAGDAAIRAVAKAVRTVTRADDMLFRWGGDEFLVLMFGISEALACQRLDSLNDLLARTSLPNGASKAVVCVSHGLATFDTKTDLHDAIEKADEAMYRSKQAAKALVRDGVE